MAREKNATVAGLRNGITTFLTPDPYQPHLDLNHPKDPDKPHDVLYTRSLLLIQMIVGTIGITLPFILFIGQAFLVRGPVRPLGSLSAYYYTPMHDVFVAGLCVIGFFLAFYMAGRSNKEFRLSLVAGLAVLGVVFFPKHRPHLLKEALTCGDLRCSPTQHWFGEGLVNVLHLLLAATFIVSLALLCIFFAISEKKRDESEKRVWIPQTGRVAIFYICAAVIFGAGVGAIVANRLQVTLVVTPLYITEVLSVWAFGVAWFVNSLDLLPVLGHPVTIGEQGTLRDQASPPR